MEDIGFLPPDIGQARGKRYYRWPLHDFSYMKLVWRHPDNLYPSGFHVLGSRLHPVGDFDSPNARLPDEPMRIYKTRKGWRVFFTGRYHVDVPAMYDELDAMGGDPLYSKYGRRKGYFAMRIDPKSRPVPENWAVTSLVAEQGRPLPEWERLIAYHDEMTQAHAPDAVLV